MVVAQAARNGRASREILFHEGLHHVALKTVFVIDYVIRDAQSLGDAARVINIIERTAAALDRFGDTRMRRSGAGSRAAWSGR